MRNLMIEIDMADPQEPETRAAMRGKGVRLVSLEDGAMNPIARLAGPADALLELLNRFWGDGFTLRGDHIFYEDQDITLPAEAS